MHGSQNIKGVTNYAVCLMTECIVKQFVRLTELQMLYHGDIPVVTMLTDL